MTDGDIPIGAHCLRSLNAVNNVLVRRARRACSEMLFGGESGRTEEDKVDEMPTTEDAGV
jgi:hypothetical protein